MKRMIISALAAVLLLSGTAYAKEKKPMTEAGDMLLFDFGANAEDGWTTVDGSTKYDKETGYGFSMVSFAEDIPSDGGGVLSDAVRVIYKHRADTEFKVDLPEGMYEISVYSGPISYMNINMEGYPVIFDMQFSSSETRIEIPVSDGCLNVALDRGSSGMELSVSAMTVRRTGDLSSRARRVFVIGDSTAATMYPFILYPPFEEGYRGGWAQMLGAYLSDVYVHNIASSGAGAATYADPDKLTARLHFAGPGDYVIIALGINDYNSVTAEEYKENLQKITETVENLGCIPVLCSDAAQLKELKNGQYRDMCYARRTAEVAAERGLTFIDLHAAHAEYLKALGDEAETLFWKQWNGSRDMTHPNRNGAGQIARLLAEELMRLDGLSGVNGYGVSEGPLLKCQVNKNTLSLINTSTHEMSYALISPVYVLKNVQRVMKSSVTVPAYDVTAPESATLVDISGFNPGSDIWLVGGGQAIRITYAARLQAR